MMENQLQQLTKDIIDAFDLAVQAMHVSSQEGFTMVSVKLDSIFAVVSKVTPEKVVLQDFSMIGTEPQAENVQVALTVIDVGSTEVNSLLQPFPSIIVNLNMLSTQVLVQLQQGVGQELYDRKKELSDGYM